MLMIVTKKLKRIIKIVSPKIQKNYSKINNKRKIEKDPFIKWYLWKVKEKELLFINDIKKRTIINYILKIDDYSYLLIFFIILLFSLNYI
jgi:hypothetical protein